MPSRKKLSAYKKIIKNCSSISRAAKEWKNKKSHSAAFNKIVRDCKSVKKAAKEWRSKKSMCRSPRIWVKGSKLSKRKNKRGYCRMTKRV